MGDLPLNQMMILVVLLMLSAFFSSAETAFSSVNKIRLKHYAEKNIGEVKKRCILLNTLSRRYRQF